MADWSDAFLQTYMQGNAERAQQKLAVQQFQWQNMWNQAKAAQDQQQHAAELAQKALYEQGMLQHDKDTTDAGIAEHQLNAMRQGAVVAQPQTSPVPLQNAAPPAQPPTLDSLPVSQSDQNPMQQQGISLPPQGAVNLGGMLLRQKTAAEQQDEQQALAAQQHGAVVKQIQQGVQDGLYTPDQAKTILALHGLKTALGGNLNEAEAAVLSPKAAAVKEGDEPLGATAANVNRMTLDRLKVLDPNITEVPPHLQVTPQTTKNQYAIVHQNLQGVEAAKAAVANAKNATEDRAARLALSQQMAELAKGRETDRVANENEKYIGPARDAAQNWQDYRAKGEFTGPGDEGLMDSYLRLINQGGRGVTKTQQELLLKAQSVKNSMAGMWAHATGGKLFSDDLRNQIGDQIEALAKVRQDGLANKGKAATTPSIPAVPAPVPSPTPTAPKVQRWGRDAQGNPIPLP